MWTTFIITSIFPIECPLSRRCWANADFLLLYLKSLACSWNLVLKGLPVCSVYIILQSGQVNWYTPLLTYLYLVLCSFERRCPIVICCERACYVRVPKYFGDVTGFFPDICEPFFFLHICVGGLFFLLFVSRYVTVWVIFVVGQDLFYGLFFFLSAFRG
jgi:hypothetical protein